MAQLDEGFRPDQLCRWNDLYRYAKYFDARRMFEPLIGDGHDAVPRCKDHIEEMVALEYLPKPPLVLDRNGVTEALEVIEDGKIVARLTNNIEVLGGAHETGIGTKGVGPP